MTKYKYFENQHSDTTKQNKVLSDPVEILLQNNPKKLSAVIVNLESCISFYEYNKKNAV